MTNEEVLRDLTTRMSTEDLLARMAIGVGVQNPRMSSILDAMNKPCAGCPAPDALTDDAVANEVLAIAKERCPSRGDALLALQTATIKLFCEIMLEHLTEKGVYPRG